MRAQFARDMTKGLLFFFRLITNRKALCDQGRPSSRDMKPTSKADITSEEHSLPDTGSADSEKVNSFLLRRHLATIRRKAPELCNKHGDVIDPNSPSFLLDICKEMDRALLRTVKDTPLPLHYLNYKDNNGTVSSRRPRPRVTETNDRFETDTAELSLPERRLCFGADALRDERHRRECARQRRQHAPHACQPRR